MDYIILNVDQGDILHSLTLCWCITTSRRLIALRYPQFLYKQHSSSYKGTVLCHVVGGRFEFVRNCVLLCSAKPGVDDIVLYVLYST